MHGQGALLFADGSKYEGSFKNDKYEGYGKETMKDGSCYEG